MLGLPVLPVHRVHAAATTIREHSDSHIMFLGQGRDVWYSQFIH